MVIAGKPGHAAADGRGAAEQVSLLKDRYLRSSLRRSKGGAEATGTGAEHHDIELLSGVHAKNVLAGPCGCGAIHWVGGR